MKLSTFILMQNPRGRDDEVYRNETEQIELTEELGFDATWLAEHHFSNYGICPDPLLLAANAAARTRRIRIGMGISVLPFQHPIRIAEQAAMVDQLSNWRLDMGIGRGYQRAEFDGFHVAMAESRGRFNEAVEILKRAWTEPSFSYQGQYYQVPTLSVLPKPIQKPHPPIWVAAWLSPETIVWAARAGYPILSPQQAQVEVIKQNHALYRQTLREAGRDPSPVELPVLAYIYCGETSERAQEEPKEAMKWYFWALTNLGSPKRDGELAPGYEHYRGWGRLTEVDYSYFADNMLIFGTPDECIAKIQRLKDELDLKHLMCWMNFGGLEQGKIVNSMRLFSREVMPAFQEAPTLGAPY